MIRWQSIGGETSFLSVFFFFLFLSFMCIYVGLIKNRASVKLEGPTRPAHLHHKSLENIQHPFFFKLISLDLVLTPTYLFDYNRNKHSAIPWLCPVYVSCVCVSARRLEVYEAEKDEAGARSMTLRSGCSRKSLSCRSLSCNRSSVSVNALTAESEEEDQLSNHVQTRTSAFCSRVVSLSQTSSHCRHFKCVCKYLKYLWFALYKLKAKTSFVTVGLQIIYLVYD